jgi:signal-transduction protein with cAMP-binding, CBS, and nucleotidyltransferase domain
MTSQTVIFRQRVSDFMRPSVLVVGSDTACGELVRRMAEADVSSAVVADDSGRAVGIVTEQDIARRVTFKTDPDALAARVMTHPVRTIDHNDYLYRAIARMRRNDMRHMPVIDDRGAAIGMLDLHDAMGFAAATLMDRIDRLTHEASFEGIKAVKAAQVDLAADLFGENLLASEIQALLSHINGDIHQRIVERGLAAMADDGWGKPPVPMTVIVMGSGGRGENYIYPDQDNGFILGDYPDADHTRIDGFFIELAERMTVDLDRVGFPLCRGYVMATNPVWRKTLSQWCEQILIWGRHRDPVAVRLFDIFFDFQPVHGPAGMAADLRDHMISRISRNFPFLQAMYGDEVEHGVALGLFGRFQTERDDPDHRGQINLKHTGTLPLVNAVRLLALRAGIAETSTLQRIAALHRASVFDDDRREALVAAFEHITRLLLRQQLADFRAGRRVSNYVPPKQLSKREKNLLVDAFRAIETLRGRVRFDLTGELF